MCAACTSPSMRASAETTSVPGWSATAATFPRTMPSTRSPPLKITLPSMRVVAPISLSILFCGLLVLLNILRSLSALKGYRVGGARLARASLVNAHLHAFNLRLRVHPESPFDPSEVLESQLESGSVSVRLLREAHHNILAPFLQADDEFHAPGEVALATGARRQEKQVVAVFARQNV